MCFLTILIKLLVEDYIHLIYFAKHHLYFDYKVVSRETFAKIIYLYRLLKNSKI